MGRRLSWFPGVCSDLGVRGLGGRTTHARSRRRQGSHGPLAWATAVVAPLPGSHSEVVSRAEAAALGASPCTALRGKCGGGPCPAGRERVDPNVCPKPAGLVGGVEEVVAAASPG